MLPVRVISGIRGAASGIRGVGPRFTRRVPNAHRAASVTPSIARYPFSTGERTVSTMARRLGHNHITQPIVGMPGTSSGYPFLQPLLARPFTSGVSSSELPNFSMLPKYKSEGSLRPLPNDALYVTNCPFPGQLIIDGRTQDSLTIFLKKIFEKAAAQFFTGDRTLEGDRTLQGDLSSKHVEALVRNIFGFKDTSGGSNPLDGLQVGLNSEDEVVVFVGIDPKKIAVPANERATNVIEINISSGSNGASLQDNWNKINTSLQNRYDNEKMDKPTIVEKFFVLLEANPTPTNHSNVIDNKIRELMPVVSFSSFIFNVYTVCLGYTKSITDVSGVDIIVPNGYGKFKQTIVETKKKNGTIKKTKSLSFLLNKSKLVTDKFRGLTSHICVLDTMPDEDIIELLKTEFPEYELSLHSEIKEPDVYEHFLCFTKVVFQNNKAEGFVVDPTTGQLVPNTAATAAGLSKKSPSPPQMKGGYKRRRTTRRKPRRARV